MAESANPKKGVFGGAPREIRDMIYSEMRELAALIWRSSGRGCKITSQCGLLATNKQLRAEYQDTITASQSRIDRSRVEILLGNPRRMRASPDSNKARKSKSLWQLGAWVVKTGAPPGSKSILDTMIEEMLSPIKALPMTATRYLSITITIDESFGFADAKTADVESIYWMMEHMRSCFRALPVYLENLQQTKQLAIELDVDVVARHYPEQAKWAGSMLCWDLKSLFSAAGQRLASMELEKMSFVASNMRGFFAAKQSGSRFLTQRHFDVEKKAWVRFLKEMGATSVVEDAIKEAKAVAKINRRARRLEEGRYGGSRAGKQAYN